MSRRAMLPVFTAQREPDASALLLTERSKWHLATVHRYVWRPHSWRRRSGDHICDLEISGVEISLEHISNDLITL